MISVDIPDKLYKDIQSFCELNSLDINKKVIDFIVQGFNITKYGLSPFKQKQKEDIVETHIDTENPSPIEEVPTIEKKPKKVKIIKK